MNAKKLLTLQGATFALITVFLWVSPEKIVWTFEFVETPNLIPYLNFLSALLLSLGMLSSILASFPEEHLKDVCAAFGTTHLLFLIVKIHQLATAESAFEPMAALGPCCDVNIHRSFLQRMPKA
ncbi:MAG: hypothetical protein AAEF23_03350 [Gammaproteobacteria bacterium]